MIKYYKNNDKTLHFIPRNKKLTSENNIFTIIVGKNGTGKSTLLANIINDLIGRSQRIFNNSELGFKEYNTGTIEYFFKPSSIIAVSTSPFDKFPLTRFNEKTNKYSYLGLRDLRTYNFSLAYMSKIISSLIGTVYKDTSQAKKITNVLKYLEYAEKIEITFDEYRTKDFLTNFLNRKSQGVDLFEDNRMFPDYIYNRSFFLNEEGAFDKRKGNRLDSIAKKFLSEKINRSSLFNLSLNRDGLEFKNHFLEKDELLFLIESGMMRLKEVSLQPLKSPSLFSIREASSGEQSVILSLLGIASKIKNKSLICIDEPEVCLHPEWQERYIQILISTFKDYKSCHFLIATHSPQIISRLQSKNCYVLSLETENVESAQKYINNSADFQLVNVFNFPGFKNEYLGRISLNLFSKITKSKKFDQNDIKNYKILLHASKQLDKEDPVYDIFLAIEEMYNAYA